MNGNNLGSPQSGINTTEAIALLTLYYEKTRPDRKPSSKSINLYVRNFFNIHRDIFEGDGETINDFLWLSEIPAIQKFLKDTNKSISTHRNYFTSLLIVAVGMDVISKEDYTEMELIRDQIIDEQKNLGKNKALKSQKQEINFIEAKYIDEKILEHENDVKIICKKENISIEDRKLIQLWMILRILRTYPMRNEVATFQMIPKRNYNKLKKQADSNTSDFSLENYIVKDNRKWFISANKYKTSAKYNEKITYVEDSRLIKNLNLFHKINGFGPMFKNSFKNDSILSHNDLSKLLANWSREALPKVKIGELDDGTPQYQKRTLSTTMLAKIFLSDEYGQAKQDMIKSAKNRGHDLKVALNDYIATPEELAALPGLQ